METGMIEYSPDILGNLNQGDCVYVKDIHDVASNLKDYVGFMRFLFETRLDVVIGDGTIDTRTAVGGVMKDILAGLDKFDDEVFNSRVSHAERSKDDE